VVDINVVKGSQKRIWWALVILWLKVHIINLGLFLIYSNKIIHSLFNKDRILLLCVNKPVFSVFKCKNSAIIMQQNYMLNIALIIY